MRRRLMILLTVLLLAVVLGDFLAWHFAEQQMRNGLADWVAARRAAGWSANSETPEAGGWPLAATLNLHNVELQGGAPDIPGGFVWRAERVVLRLDIIHPAVLRIEADGGQHLRVADAPDIPFSAGHLHLLVPLKFDPSDQPLNLHGDTLRVGIPARGADAVLTLGRLDIDAVVHSTAAQRQPAVSMTAHAKDVVLPSRLPWPLGPRIESIDLDGTLNGPLPNAIGLTAAATAWRDGGGSLDVRRIQTHWGPLGLNGTATLALDPDLQPMGTGTAHVTGYAETLDAMARNGLMSRSAATSAKAVLSLLADTPEDHGQSQVEVPLSLQHRALSMLQVPLLRLPELDWPRP